MNLRDFHNLTLRLNLMYNSETVWYWHKETYTSKGQKRESQNRLKQRLQIDFDKSANISLWRKHSVFNK